MQDSGSSPCGRPPRRLILGAAAALGLVTALTPHMPTVLAAGPAIVIVQADTTKDPAGATAGKGADLAGRPTTPSAAPAVPPPPAIPAPPRAAKPDADSSDVDADDDTSATDHATIDKRTIIIDKGGKRVRVGVLGRDREYDSFEQFVQDAPWLAGLVFLTVMLVFLVPLLIIVLLIWYKIRKTRMQNETMLKLAEKGVVPPAEAMDAIGATRPQAAMEAGSTTGALYARARSIRARNVWSDLRRGIILVAVGLAVQTCSMFENGEASGIGLVLLFLGIGYVVLWYFEDRRDPVPPRVDTGADRTP